MFYSYFFFFYKFLVYLSYVGSRSYFCYYSNRRYLVSLRALYGFRNLSLSGLSRVLERGHTLSLLKFSTRRVAALFFKKFSRLVRFFFKFKAGFNSRLSSFKLPVGSFFKVHFFFSRVARLKSALSSRALLLYKGANCMSWQNLLLRGLAFKKFRFTFFIFLKRYLRASPASIFLKKKVNNSRAFSFFRRLRLGSARICKRRLLLSYNCPKVTTSPNRFLRRGFLFLKKKLCMRPLFLYRSGALSLFFLKIYAYAGRLYVVYFANSHSFLINSAVFAASLSGLSYDFFKKKTLQHLFKKLGCWGVFLKKRRSTATL